MNLDIPYRQRERIAVNLYNWFADVCIFYHDDHWTFAINPKAKNLPAKCTLHERYHPQPFIYHHNTYEPDSTFWFKVTLPTNHPTKRNDLYENLTKVHSMVTLICHNLIGSSKTNKLFEMLRPRYHLNVPTRKELFGETQIEEENKLNFKMTRHRQILSKTKPSFPENAQPYAIQFPSQS